jgi:hypothetical protein
MCMVYNTGGLPAQDSWLYIPQFTQGYLTWHRIWKQPDGKKKKSNGSELLNYDRVQMLLTSFAGFLPPVGHYCKSVLMHVDDELLGPVACRSSWGQRLTHSGSRFNTCTNP